MAPWIFTMPSVSHSWQSYARGALHREPESKQEWRGLRQPIPGIQVSASEVFGHWGQTEQESFIGLQGREKEIAIFSAVRSGRTGKIGFVADERRINVGLTRARCSMLVIGNAAALKSDTVWHSLLRHSRCKRYTHIPPNPFLFPLSLAPLPQLPNLRPPLYSFPISNLKGLLQGALPNLCCFVEL